MGTCLRAHGKRKRQVDEKSETSQLKTSLAGWMKRAKPSSDSDDKDLAQDSDLEVNVDPDNDSDLEYDTPNSP